MLITRARPHQAVDASKTRPKDPPVTSAGSTPPFPDLASYVEHLVEQAPPLSISQQDSLGVLLKGVSA